MNTKEIKYVPIYEVPVFRFVKPEKPIEVQDFWVTCLVLNNLQPTGKVILVLLWMLPMICFILTAAAIDIALFLIAKNLIVFLWKVIGDTATGLIGKAARVLGIAAAAFLVFVFFHSGAWKTVEEYLVELLNW